MDKDKRTGWLRELRVGDKVILKSYYVGESVQTITKITPTGNIKINDILYDHTGTGYRTSGYNSDKLIKWTIEKEKEIIKNRQQMAMITVIEKANFRGLNDSDIERIYIIIKQNVNREDE